LNSTNDVYSEDIEWLGKKLGLLEIDQKGGNDRRARKRNGRDACERSIPASDRWVSSGWPGEER
jgi:hypothetical protein